MKRTNKFYLLQEIMSQVCFIFDFSKCEKIVTDLNSEIVTIKFEDFDIYANTEANVMTCSYKLTPNSFENILNAIREYKLSNKEQ